MTQLHPGKPSRHWGYMDLERGMLWLTVCMSDCARRCTSTYRIKGEVWNGEKVIIDRYKSSFNPYKGKCYMEIIPADKEKFEITDNNQVYDKTIFID